MDDRDIDIGGIATLLTKKAKWVVHKGAHRARLIGFINFVIRYS